MLGTKVLWALLGLAAAANVLVYKNLYAPPVRSDVLRAGSGTVVLVRVREARAALVGAGADASIVRALGEALPFWQRRLDALVLLDPSAKTAGGAPFVLASYSVAHLIRPSEQGTSAREEALASAERASGTQVTEIPPHGRVILHYGGRSLELSAP